MKELLHWILMGIMITGLTGIGVLLVFPVLLETLPAPLVALIRRDRLRQRP